MPLMEYWWVGILAVLFVAYFIVIYFKKGKDETVTKLRELALKLMLLAEKKFESEEGQEKFEWVVNKIYEEFPDVIKFFVSREDLEQYIQELYFSVKDILDDGELNDSPELNEVIS